MLFIYLLDYIRLYVANLHTLDYVTVILLAYSESGTYRNFQMMKIGIILKGS